MIANLRLGLVGWCLCGLMMGVLGRPTQAQVLTGRITDARTGAPLTAATVQVQDTYTGTITNAEGRFELRVDSLPVTLVVQHIGYKTLARRVTTPGPHALTLQPTRVALPELTVTGPNFAENIMRKVIRQKRSWWPRLETYAVEAYNRFTIRNDTGIVSIIETQTRAFWKQGEGFREVMRARRQTANLAIDGAVPAALFVANLYADNITLGGHRLVGVTHPDAVDRYRFRIDSVRVRDGQRVYDLRVTPASGLMSGFRGTISVLDSTYAMIAADLRPSAAFRFPPPLQAFDVRMQQQFDAFGGPFWLPVDFRASMRIKVGLSALLDVPPVRVRQVSRLSEYRVNGPVPDSLFAQPQRAVATRAPRAAAIDSMRADTLRMGAVPLSRAEQRAYTQIDSSDTLEDAFQPTGPLARILEIRNEVARVSAVDTAASGPVNLGFEPSLWYNRVEGGHLGGRATMEAGPVQVAAGGAYNTSRTGPTRWTYEGRASLDVGATTQVGGTYRYGIDPRFPSDPYGRFITSISALLGESDYYDYLGNERWRATVTQQLSPWNAELRARYNHERHFPVARTTSYDLLGVDEPFPPNPPVARGVLQSVDLRARWASEDNVPLGFGGQKRVKVLVEHAPAAWNPARFSFTRVRGSVTWRFETFFPRRFLSNTLDVRFSGGTFRGTLPLARFGIVEGGIDGFTPFGTLRTLDGQPYQGEQHAAFFWEHNFRTVPFELLGWRAPAAANYNVILYGAHARSWVGTERLQNLRARGITLPVPNGWHHEIGVSLSGLFDLLRIDATWRLDQPAFSLGVGAARLL
ncbi:DUF5686 and carboxypeptidase-like regulatory domain-containing protein [Salisaeta longa]|uniref:DUF5686 and carboxypeptidase-like regulatory domain-containing protein n=1 Tax=Salisaeta longa TaxID=503170 RepID=UPI00146EAA84|nr:DUF5686 and carboxypeptidase-like regulatory domain-containing protein [Salisaeta longa]